MSNIMSNISLWKAFFKLFCFRNGTKKEAINLITSWSSELLTRLELVTSSLPRKCSTTELQQQNSSRDGMSSLFAVTKVVLFFNLPKLSAIFLVISVSKSISGRLDRPDCRAWCVWAKDSIDTKQYDFKHEWGGSWHFRLSRLLAFCIFVCVCCKTIY